MTLLVSWVGVVDRNRPASLYIASDSRISWGSSNHNFDSGRKVFGFKNSPDIMGYCGDVLFPSIVINQIVEMADNGLLFENNMTSIEKFKKVEYCIQEQFKLYPNEVNTIICDTLKIIFASRDSRYSFTCHVMSWKRGNEWVCEKVEIPEKSGVLTSLGSGKNEFDQYLSKYQSNKSLNSGTSRSVFHCFCDVLENMKDRQCGGSPQLVGLYNIGNARNFGIIYQNKRYVLGMEVPLKHTLLSSLEWRNALFEICDVNTLKIMGKAQKQPNQLSKSIKRQLPNAPQDEPM